ncbi:PTS sugar transporter subunit IIA [Bacillus sp. SA1-12]|uniref:BglG family transcription antiterminator n=1 Tax=Bacillus sp. SA1-12 TaxID=1455638 RepID=UPI000626FF60|nr:BglG family transcription antiterminator [Bacillus sp. SA1-12]KKI89128.1 PTS sugar transporter subunit IIA [Bacillus sp. SA1-12]
MNERQKEILMILLTEIGKPLFVQSIAERIGYSEKTVRNDFKIIETFLNGHLTAKLVRKPGLGVYIEIDEVEKTQLFKMLQETSSMQKDVEESFRVMQIAYQLLMSKAPVSAQEIAEKYYVNKSVIKKDLDTIEKWLDQKGLTLVSKQKVGVSVEGTETNKRKALAQLPELNKDTAEGADFISKQFSSHEITIIQGELNDFQRQYSLFFTDETTERLVIHILMMIRRTKLGQAISLAKQELEYLSEKQEFKWASTFLKKLEIIFVVHFSEEEIAYFTLHLLGGRHRLPKHHGTSEKTDDLQGRDQHAAIIEDLLKQMTELTKLDFTDDDSLREGLSIHLYSALNRIKFGLTVSNPMLNEIKRMYPYIFDSVIHVIEELNNKFSISIPEEEAAYLTIHFQASIERLRQNHRNKLNAIIVCHMGIGMSQLLNVKLEKKFQSLNIIDSIAKADLREYLDHHNLDLIISTIDLVGLKIPHIVISPLLEGAEEKRLKEFIAQQTAGANQLNSALVQYVETSALFLQYSSEHRFKIIEELANALYDGGFVGKEYGYSAILRERMSATTIGSGIAIPHGNPKLIKKPAIAVAALKHPIEWSGENVSLVFMLAVPNQDQQTTKQLFRELSSISEQPALLKKLTDARSIDQFLSLLK